MVDLADAEKEQEAWFNQTVQKASKPEQPKHIQWLDEVVEEEDSDSEDDSDDESDDESVYDEEDFNYIPLRKLRSPPVTFSSKDMEDSEQEIDAEEDEEDIADGYPLERVPSHSVEHSPPELLDDSESDDDQDTTPPSPESEAMELDEKQREAITTTNFYEKSDQSIEEYIMQQAQQPSQPMIAAY